jgi:hypothetical protein
MHVDLHIYLDKPKYCTYERWSLSSISSMKVHAAAENLTEFKALGVPVASTYWLEIGSPDSVHRRTSRWLNNRSHGFDGFLPVLVGIPTLSLSRQLY